MATDILTVAEEYARETGVPMIEWTSAHVEGFRRRLTTARKEGRNAEKRPADAGLPAVPAAARHN